MTACHSLVVTGGSPIVDVKNDMESGRQAGVSTAAVLWGPFTREHLTGSQPDHWLERPSDLMALFGD